MRINSPNLMFRHLVHIIQFALTLVTTENQLMECVKIIEDVTSKFKK